MLSTRKSLIKIARELAIRIVSLPDELDPRDVVPVEELMEVFQEEGIVLNRYVRNSKTTMNFWLTNCVPGHQSWFFYLPCLILSKGSV